MSRQPTSASYITPIKQSDGVPEEEDGNHHGRGVFRLSATTFIYPLGGQDASLVHAHLWWDADLVATSITVEECDFPEGDVDWYDDTSGFWLPTSIDRITSTVEGAGATNTNDVLAIAGGAAGGGALNITDNGARRLRLKVVVATAGHVRCSAWGKE